MIMMESLMRTMTSHTITASKKIPMEMESEIIPMLMTMEME